MGFGKHRRADETRPVEEMDAERPAQSESWWTRGRITLAAGALVVAASGGVVALTVRNIVYASPPDAPDYRSRVVKGGLIANGMPMPNEEPGKQVALPGMADVINSGTELIWLCKDPSQGQFVYALKTITATPNKFSVRVDSGDRDLRGRVSKAEIAEYPLNSDEQVKEFIAYNTAVCTPQNSNMPSTTTIPAHATTSIISPPSTVS